MKCEDIQFNLALFVDDPLSESEASNLEAHLVTCPLCRQSMADMRDIRQELRTLSRPQVPVPVVDSIRNSVRAKAESAGSVYGLLNPVVMPRSYRLLIMSYVAGACASLVLGLTFLSIILSGGPSGRRDVFLAGGPRGSRVMTTNSAPGVDVSRLSLSPKDYANTRSDIGSFSPSVNPQGSLIDLTRSLVTDDLKGDEVVVVADVFENGSAQIAEVVEPSRNEKAVDELARALDYESANTPFVPATLDQRSDTIRVVLKIQSVYVSTKERPRRSRAL